MSEDVRAALEAAKEQAREMQKEARRLEREAKSQENKNRYQMQKELEAQAREADAAFEAASIAVRLQQAWANVDPDASPQKRIRQYFTALTPAIADEISTMAFSKYTPPPQKITALSHMLNYGIGDPEITLSPVKEMLSEMSSADAIAYIIQTVQSGEWTTKQGETLMKFIMDRDNATTIQQLEKTVAELQRMLESGGGSIINAEPGYLTNGNGSH